MERISPLLALALAACATVPAAGNGPVAALGQVAHIDGLQVRPLSIVEDSRCPMNARCIWAGRIIVRSEISGGNWHQVRDLELGKPMLIADGQLTLVSAEPATMAGVKLEPRAYRFTFSFEGGF